MALVSQETKKWLTCYLASFKDNSDPGEGKTRLPSQKKTTVLNLAGWVNILQCWGLPSRDSIFLSRNHYLSDEKDAQSILNSLVSSYSTLSWMVAFVWYLAITYTPKLSFPSPTISKLYGSLPCPQLQFDNPTLVWEETKRIRFLCPKQLIHLTWLSSSFPGSACPGSERGQPQLSLGVRARGWQQIPLLSAASPLDTAKYSNH